MAVMEKLKIFVVKEPVVAASCLIAGFGTHPSFPSANPTRCAPCARALGAQCTLLSVCLGLALVDSVRVGLGRYGLFARDL